MSPQEGHDAAPGRPGSQSGPGPPVPRTPADPNVKIESLGKQTIEGVVADGTRTTMTIPAGEIGNEQPLQVVTETWYSSELQAVVLSKRTDPRSGEHVTRMTNITRAEPSRSLFEVPPISK